MWEKPAGEVEVVRALHKRFKSVFYMQGVLSLCIAGYVVHRAAASGVSQLDIMGIAFIGIWIVALGVVQLRWLIALSSETAKHVEKMILYDDLTAVYNHRFISLRLDEELNRAKRHNRPLSVIYVDVDHFKRVNDNHGHNVGDVILREVAGVLKANARSIDIVGRLGGDEFFVILPDTVMEGAALVARRFCRSMRSWQYRLDDGTCVDYLRMSIGVAGYPPNATDVDSLMAAADQAMYAAKKAGGDTAEIAAPREQPVTV